MRRGIGRITGSLAPALAVVATLVVSATAALRPDGRAPTDGEALLAAGIFAARNGRVGAVGLPVTDLLAARQLAAVTALVPELGSVWETVRAGMLVPGVVTAVLLWPILRRLGCAPLPTALAIAVVGAAAPAVALHTAVTAAAVAVPWLLLAAVLVGRGRVRSFLAAAAAAVAVMTAPLLGAALLALGAHWAADPTVSPLATRRRRIAAALPLAVAAVAVAAAASGVGPLAGVAGAPVSTPAAVVGALVGFAVVGVGGRVRWVRPLLTPAVLLLAVLLVPGPGRGAAALAVLPLLGAVAAAVADDVAVRLPERRHAVLWPAVAVVVAVALAGVVVRPVAARPDPTPASLASWIDVQLAPDAAVHADGLDRAELVAAGFPAERLRGLGDPAGGGDAVLVNDRVRDAPAVGCPALLATLPRWGGTQAQLCAARPPAAPADDPEEPSRVRIGTALAGNPALRLEPAAADLLAGGHVDPRVMIVLGALSASHTLAVADFPLAAFEPPGTLRRGVLITSVDGRAAAGDAPGSLPAWFGSQHPPFVPSMVRADASGLLVCYRVPSPSGLLPG